MKISVLKVNVNEVFPDQDNFKIRYAKTMTPAKIDHPIVFTFWD